MNNEKTLGQICYEAYAARMVIFINDVDVIEYPRWSKLPGNEAAAWECVAKAVNYEFVKRACFETVITPNNKE
jgi:hypothetical protein